MSDAGNKPREFWISEIILGEIDTKTRFRARLSSHPIPNKDNIHVIEHSAYQQLKEKHDVMTEGPYKGALKAISQLQSRLDMAVECLKFYAAEENWEFTSDFHGHESYEEIKDDEECTAPCMSYGGKRAREVLKQIQGEENERK